MIDRDSGPHPVSGSMNPKLVLSRKRKLQPCRYRHTLRECKGKNGRHYVLTEEIHCPDPSPLYKRCLDEGE